MTIDADTTCDVLVIGSGVAGLSAAISAAHHGRTVVVVDAARELGGTGAISGGWVYVPGNRHGRDQGDSRDQVESYIRALAGEHLDEPRLAAFLDTVDDALTFFESETLVEFIYPDQAPDYEMRQPGARTGGRAIHAAPVDGRALGAYRTKLRRPLREMTVFGVMPQIGTELQHFVRANRSVRSFAFAARKIARTSIERLIFGRPLTLSNGNGLMGRLVASAAALGIPMHPRVRAMSLVRHDGAVTGAIVRTPSGTFAITARDGVVLACGGFSHDEALRRAHFPDVGSYGDTASPMTAEHRGEAVRLVAGVGGHIDDRTSQPAAWAPVTTFTRAGRTRRFPHIRTIGLPGTIAVGADGRRFTNESDSYHAFGQAMMANTPPGADVEAFLVCDARTMRRYGLGYAKPWPIPRFGYLSSGYLLTGRTLRELAERAGIDPDGLEAEIAEYNVGARAGEDPRFGRGTTAYNRARGDADHTPNPTIAPVEQAPYYATKVRLGDLGTYAGLAVDADSAVLDADGEPVTGLYALGTAAASVFGGAYPGYGAVLGPSLVLGYRLGTTLAERASA